MFSNSKSRFNIRELQRALNYLSFSPDSYSNSNYSNSNYSNSGSNSKTAIAVSGTAVSGVLLAYYRFRRNNNDRNVFKFAKDIFKERIQKQMATKKKKKTNKAIHDVTIAASAAAATVAQLTPVVTSPAMSAREKRFLEFASVECDGQAFMTPKDFLEASIHELPTNERIIRHVLTRDEVERMNRTRGAPSKDYFRSLGKNGLISYTEFLFLLCILTKPQASFRVAFNMLDVDRNNYIDKKEFLVMERIFSTTKFSKRLLQGRQFEQIRNYSQTNGELLNSQITQAQPKISTPSSHEHAQTSVVDRMKLETYEQDMDTILMRRFFGRNGRHVLTYDEFHKFMEDLQTEMLELEFNEFSHGQDVIKERDFAKLLLRHAFAHKDAYLSYLRRIEERLENTTGITFDHYRQFCLFLTNLDDFSMVVKLYTYNDLPVTQNEFARAAKVSTGFALDDHLLDTIFKIFDINEDGRLSYGEFISVMRDRLNRGARRAGPKTDWQQFKKCVREEIRRY